MITKKLMSFALLLGLTINTKTYGMKEPVSKTFRVMARVAALLTTTFAAGASTLDNVDAAQPDDLVPARYFPWCPRGQQPICFAGVNNDSRVYDPIIFYEESSVHSLQNYRSSPVEGYFTGPYEKTALHAVVEGDLDGEREDEAIAVANDLINKGADVNACNSHEETPLHKIISMANTRTREKKAMLEEHQNDYFVCPCTYGARMIRFLINAGANVNIAGPQGQTPFDYAIRGGNLIAMRLLLDAGVQDVNTQRNYKGAIHIAAGQGDVAFIRYLISKGVNALAEDHFGQTAVHHAIHNENRTVIVFLVNELGLDVNKRGGIFGLTPIHAAIDSLNPTAVEALISVGANIHLKLGMGTPLMMARKQRDELVDLYRNLRQEDKIKLSNAQEIVTLLEEAGATE